MFGLRREVLEGRAPEPEEVLAGARRGHGRGRPARRAGADRRRRAAARADRAVRRRRALREAALGAQRPSTRGLGFQPAARRGEVVRPRRRRAGPARYATRSAADVPHTWPGWRRAARSARSAAARSSTARRTGRGRSAMSAADEGRSRSRRSTRGQRRAARDRAPVVARRTCGSGPSLRTRLRHVHQEHCVEKRHGPQYASDVSAPVRRRCREVPAWLRRRHEGLHATHVRARRERHEPRHPGRASSSRTRGRSRSGRHARARLATIRRTRIDGRSRASLQRHPASPNRHVAELATNRRKGRRHASRVRVRRDASSTSPISALPPWMRRSKWLAGSRRADDSRHLRTPTRS